MGALSSRVGRHCSHPSGCSGRVLPATLLPLKGTCSDFPHQSCPPKVVARLSALSPIERFPDVAQSAQFCTQPTADKIGATTRYETKVLYYTNKQIAITLLFRLFAHGV